MYEEMLISRRRMYEVRKMKDQDLRDKLSSKLTLPSRRRFKNLSGNVYQPIKTLYCQNTTTLN